MSVTICFDFGNTRLKAAIFQHQQLAEVIVIENDGNGTIESLLKEFDPQKIILSSVINHNPEIETQFAARAKFHKLNHVSNLPFTTPVGKPETIGADRLALSAAAVYFFPKQHNLVIGMGSCITY
ncbi:MAG TPA: type III pantothenate kinase, partial [Chitinophagaceae bacterium]